MIHDFSTASIVVLGSVNMDLITTSERLPRPGETLLGLDFATGPGGKGANQAIAAAKAGGTVQFVGAVGSDDFGIRLRNALLSGGVGVEGLRTVPGPSGIAAITVDAAAENTIIVVAGANSGVTGLTAADISAIGQAGLLVCQLEIPLEAVRAGVATAAAAGVPVLLNPSPVRELPAELLAGVTVLVVNQGEAEALGAGALAQVPHVITTLGGAGADYRGPDTSFHVDAPTVEAVDTTGAGDAFTGALAVAWSGGVDARTAVHRACAAGALATTRPGASTSSPSAAQIDQLAGSSYLS